MLLLLLLLCCVVCVCVFFFFFFFKKKIFFDCLRLLLCVSFLHQLTLTLNRFRRLKRLWYKILIRLKVDSPWIYQQFLLAAVIRIKSYVI